MGRDLVPIGAHARLNLVRGGAQNPRKPIWGSGMEEMPWKKTWRREYK